MLREESSPRRRFDVSITGVRFLGRGSAYRLESSALLALHDALARRFVAELIPQDQQRFQPHVVVQNKVPPHEARGLYEELLRSFEPWRCEAVGLDWWEYLDGPWRHVERFAFAESELA